MLLLAHSLEKGMSLPTPHSNFGLAKANQLLAKLEDYKDRGGDLERWAFIEALSVLEAYCAITTNDVSSIEAKIKQLRTCTRATCPAGYVDVPSMASIYDGLDLEQDSYFLTSRHSVRHYQTKTVSVETMAKVIDLAESAPSACNRQPARIHWTSDAGTVAQISKVIPGNKGFEAEVPNWALVTEDRSLFGSTEYLQWYVNGGVYVAYFIQALHAYGIGSCVFQLPIAHECIQELKAIAQIPDNETLIVAVGFGYASVRNKFTAAARRPDREVISSFTS